MNNFKINIKGYGQLPLHDFTESELVFENKKLNSLERSKISMVFNYGRDIKCTIERNDNTPLTFEAQVLEMMRDGKLTTFKIRMTETTFEQAPSPKFPEHLVMVKGSPFHDYAIEHIMTDGEVYHEWTAAAFWTDEQLVREGYVRRKTLQLTGKQHGNLEQFKICGWTDELLIKYGIAEWVEDDITVAEMLKEPQRYVIQPDSEWERLTVDFQDIQDNLDFMELVDKFYSEFDLKGGQNADGTWYLKGERK